MDFSIFSMFNRWQSILSMADGEFQVTKMELGYIYINENDMRCEQYIFVNLGVKPKQSNKAKGFTRDVFWPSLLSKGTL